MVERTVDERTEPDDTKGREILTWEKFGTATRELAELDLEAALAWVGVSTAEARFFNRFGQLIYREPLGGPPTRAFPYR